MFLLNVYKPGKKKKGQRASKLGSVIPKIAYDVMLNQNQPINYLMLS